MPRGGFNQTDYRSGRGQVIPLVALLVVVACGLVVVLGRLGADAVNRARAQTTADAAALAGAGAGRDEAAAVAAENGARLIGWEQSGPDVRVVVERAGFRASARARRSAAELALGRPSGLLSASETAAGRYAPSR